MKYFLVFEKSGDYIELDTNKQDLVEFYIGWLNSNNVNRFSNNVLGASIQNAINNLTATLKQFNQTIASKLLGKFEYLGLDTDLLDQNILNQLHCQWVHSNHKLFRIDDIKQLNSNGIYQSLLDQINDEFDQIPFGEIVYKYGIQDLYNDINLNVHYLECKFNRIKFTADFDMYNWQETPNTFPRSYTSNSTGNLSIGFNHYGRTLYNKFQYQSEDFYDDENTYNQLLGYVELSFLPPETINYSSEYLAWCKKIGRQPGGQYLNIGNILDLSEKLTDYRKLLYRNLSDKFTLSLTK